MRDGEVEREDEGSLFGWMSDGGGASEGGAEGDVGSATAGVTASGGGAGAVV